MVLCPTWALATGHAFVHRGADDPDPLLATIWSASDEGVQISLLTPETHGDRLHLQLLRFPARHATWHLGPGGQLHVQLHITGPAGARWYLTGDGEVIPGGAEPERAVDNGAGELR